MLDTINMNGNVAKIKSIKYVGKRRSYNICMESSQHNYLIKPSSGQPIHKNSHSIGYITEAYWCAWLKAHFPPEWWASVMSYCHHVRLKRYMNVARSEGVKFGPINIEDLSPYYSVDPETHKVTPGLISIKGIGQKAADKLSGKGKYDNIDDFVDKFGKDKRVMERLILLGAFQKYHPNIKATWIWYQYKYCSGAASREIKKHIKSELLADWTDERIEQERKRQADEYFKLYPNRRKLPNKIANWNPKPDDTRENVMALIEDDYANAEKFNFEKEYLGYYWRNPIEYFKTDSDNTIINAKKNGGGFIDVVIESFEIAETRKGGLFGRLAVMDGSTACNVYMWEGELDASESFIDDGIGIRLNVDYNDGRRTFSVKRGSVPVILEMSEDQ